MTTLPPGCVIEDRPAAWLHEGWKLARTVPGACTSPDDVAGVACEWHDAKVPGTVASSLHSDIEVAGDYDAHDWWYRLRFASPGGATKRARHSLRFDGLATIAEAWLNGSKIVSSRNMFVAKRVDVGALLRDGENELVLCFRSLGAELARRHPRPRWKTALVAQQALRWFRTTLLGRIPGWTPAIAPVGPWGPIALERAERVEIHIESLHAWAGQTTGKLRLRARVEPLDETPIGSARLVLGEEIFPVAIEEGAIRADLSIPGVPLWWPHTHGKPALLPCRLEIEHGGEWRAIDCGAVGFRDLQVDTSAGAVRFVINGTPVFCRGACWLPLDPLAVRAARAKLREALEQLRDAGANMVRVGGTGVYESTDFYRLCDELGILVWQDFMFANMDYPFADEAFRGAVEEEARAQLSRLQRHACIAAYCGGSEVAQQAAMMGLPREQWANAFFMTDLARLCEELHPGIAYFPSTPWGGALPFHVGEGLAHYYGVGAYRRPLEDVKLARVKFTPECLGFSNVPEPETLELLGEGAVPHHPRWKAAVPRDSGAGYDFEDVRDHYFERLFGREPVAVRASSLPRYLAASRIVTGEAMARVFSEWRAPASTCGGALVWFHRDLRPGAGWGIVDSTGRPKAAYWFLRRAWQPRALRITDEGLDGLALHAINETDAPLDAVIELELLNAGCVVDAAEPHALRIEARGARTLGADRLLGRFTDAGNVYRFGPPKYDVIAARMRDEATGDVIAEDFFFPTGLELPVRAANVRAHAEWSGNGVALQLETDSFLQAVRISSSGFAPDDNYFHLAPGRAKAVALRAPRDSRDCRIDIEALNWSGCATLRPEERS